MDWQTSDDTAPAALVPEADERALRRARPPVTGAWRDGDPVGDRRFAPLGELRTEAGATIPFVRLAYESWGELDAERSNAVLVLHALTGDSHVRGDAGPGHATAGWWGDVVGPGLAIDTDRWFVVAPNMLGGCQGSTGPASIAPDGQEWEARFPYVTVRDQVAAQAALADALGIARWAAVVGGSMGGMQALEWAIGHPDRTQRVAVLAAPPFTTADQIAQNAAQIETIRMDPAFDGGAYYDADEGEGPHRGLALARRLAMLTYRSRDELNQRFSRSWQSPVSPLGRGGRFAVSSYLDFHGNRFTRRFDANSYVTLVEAMNSHDIGRGRGGVEEALSRASARALVMGIDTDQMFPLDGQQRIARGLAGSIDGREAVVLRSDFGHDGFLIETDVVSEHLLRLLES